VDAPPNKTTSSSVLAQPLSRRQGLWATGIVISISLLCVGVVTVVFWPLVEIMTGGVFKPKWESYETMVADGSLIGLTPDEAERIIEYPARLHTGDGVPVAMFDIVHLGWIDPCWIEGKLDEDGRITSVELVYD